MAEEAPPETPQEQPVAPVPSVEDAVPAEPPVQSTPTKDTVMLDAPNDRNAVSYFCCSAPNPAADAHV